MPIYEYKCRQCGKVNEFLIGVARDKTEIKCHFCGSVKLDKIFSKSYTPTAGTFSGPRGGKTCCGREERCDTPPCSDGGACCR